MFFAVIRNAAGTIVRTSQGYASHGTAQRMVTLWANQEHYRGARTGTVESAPDEWTNPAPPAPQPLVLPLHTFTAWPKIARLMRDVTVTEKIDGTNSAIAIVRAPAGTEFDGPPAHCVFGPDGTRYAVFAQSRKRLITPGKSTDNAGFAAWVWDNATELVTALGDGTHFGEWWGSGINRGYGLPSGEKRFSLFNTDKHADVDRVIGDVRTTTVPVLHRGQFDTEAVKDTLAELSAFGSFAAPGFDKPEGVCVFHHASRTYFKVTLDAQDAGKWEAA